MIPKPHVRRLADVGDGVRRRGWHAVVTAQIPYLSVPWRPSLKLTSAWHLREDRAGPAPGSGLL